MIGEARIDDAHDPASLDLATGGGLEVEDLARSAHHFVELGTDVMRADLSQSTLFRVFPRLATVESMRLMQRPTNARVDFDLARTIASREGLKAVLDGDIVSLGGRYILTTRLMSASGEQLATFSEEQP